MPRGEYYYYYYYYYYKLSPIPIASVATSTSTPESGELNNLACSNLIAEIRQLIC